jgi:hypothetical protein
MRRLGEFWREGLRSSFVISCGYPVLKRGGKKAPCSILRSCNLSVLYLMITILLFFTYNILPGPTGREHTASQRLNWSALGLISRSYLIHDGADRSIILAKAGYWLHFIFDLSRMNASQALGVQSKLSGCCTWKIQSLLIRCKRTQLGLEMCTTYLRRRPYRVIPYIHFVGPRTYSNTERTKTNLTWR